MRVERIEIIVTDLPVRLRRRVATGTRDTGESGSLRGKPVLVRIHAEGITGYGQVRPIGPGHFLPDTVPSTVAAIRDVYGPHLIGRQVCDLEAIWHEFDALLPANANARAALDHALHDALGKAYGVPVHQLLGGMCQPDLPLEWSVGLAEDPEQMLDECRRAVREFGVRVLCLKAGGPGGWRQDVRNVMTVRETFGADVEIGLDANTRWSVGHTLRVIRALRDHDLSYVEQPIERADHAGLALIRSAADGVTIMADESVMSPRDALALARANAVDALCVKLYKVGGLRQGRKVAAVAEAANLQVNIGGTAIMSQLEAAASAHYFASIPPARAFGGAEFVFGLGVVGADPLVPEPTVVIRNGMATVPTGAGLGVVVDDAAVDRLAILTDVVPTGH